MLCWETATQYWDPMLPRRRNVINKLSKRRRLHTPGTRPRAEEEERLPTKRHGQIKTEGGRPGGDYHGNLRWAVAVANHRSLPGSGALRMPPT